MSEANTLAPPTSTGRRRSHLALPAGIFLLGLGCSLLASFQLDRVLHTRELERFESQTIRIRSRISERLDTYVAMMQGAVSLLATEPTLTNAQFDAYISGLRLQTRYPGISFIGFSRHIDAAMAPALTAEMRAQGDSDFHLWPPKTAADSAREGRDAIVFLSPVTETNKPSVGFDMRSEPVRRAAMDRALKSSQAAATAQLELLSINGDKPLGFIIYLPVVNASGYIGDVYSSFRTRNLFQAVVAEELRRAINIAAYDGPPLPENLLFDSATADGQQSRVRSSLPLPVAGRTWTLQFAAASGYANLANPQLVPLSFVFGVLATLLLTAVSWMQVRARLAAEHARGAIALLNTNLEARVAERTRDLEHAHTLLRDHNELLEETVEARTGELRARNEEMRQFVHVVSHDLRAPLVNILGFVGELESLERERREAQARSATPMGNPPGSSLDEEFTEALGFVRTSARKLERLIGAILKLSREGRRSLHGETIAMADLLTRIADDLRFQCEQRGASIKVFKTPDLVSDRLSVEQIFGNLLENAVKYLSPDRPGEITVTGRAEGARLIYEVKDNGRGIAPADQEKVFELFRRVGTDQPGEGLGLTSVKMLTRQLGAEVTLSSTPGEGTLFRLSFPRRWVAADAA